MKGTSIKINTIANYIGQFYSLFIGVVILPLYLKYLGTESYGLVGFFTLVQSWMILLDMGLTATLSREVAKLKNKEKGLIDLKHLIKSLEIFFWFIGILVIISFFNFSSFISNNWLDVKELSIVTVETSVRLMALIILPRWFVGFYRGAIIGFEKHVWLNIYRVVINTFKFVGAYLFIKYIDNDILKFFIYQIFIGVIELCVIRNKVFSLLPKIRIIIPSFEPFKNIISFAIKIAFTSGVWVFITQLDKLLLSHYISLTKYGYFSLVVAISGSIIHLSAPLGKVLLPRMVSLFSNDQKNEMLYIYHKGTKFLSIIILSVVSILSFFSYELLYSWTGDVIASTWASPILFWYVLGNGFVSILAFQYYLQYANGNLYYHVRFNIIFLFIALPIIFYSVNNHGAVGASFAWFCIHAITFIIWPPFIHSKFAKGHHKSWILKDILPALSFTTFFIVFIKQVEIEFKHFSRFETFIILFGLGLFLLAGNVLVTFSIENIVSIKKIIKIRKHFKKKI